MAAERKAKIARLETEIKELQKEEDAEKAKSKRYFSMTHAVNDPWHTGPSRLRAEFSCPIFSQLFVPGLKALQAVENPTLAGCVSGHTYDIKRTEGRLSFRCDCGLLLVATVAKVSGVDPTYSTTLEADL